MSKAQTEFDDIQGLLRFGYKHLTQAAFLLLRVKDRRAARDWLASVPVTSAATQQPPPDIALHVALSSDGLRALGVANDVIDGFSPEFRVGLGNEQQPRTSARRRRAQCAAAMAVGCRPARAACAGAALCARRLPR